MRYLERHEAIEFEDEVFDLCRAVKIYYIAYGRNAWNSTWITRYFPGCMHNNFESARNTTEKMRVQGSVFYIRELPALQFVNSKFSIVVTEINTDYPLKQCDAMEGDIVTLLDLYDNFLPIKPNSVIQLKQDKFINGEHIPTRFERLPDDHVLVRYRSFSQGGGYRLGWSKEENKIVSLSVQTLASKFNNLVNS